MATKKSGKTTKTAKPEREAPATWAELLNGALTEPGRMNKAFSAFHNYSFQNMLLALVQCDQRGLPVGPIATYQGWLNKGRQVRKGEKAMVLCAPRTFKVTETRGGEDVEKTGMMFYYKASWFVLAQTDGEDVPVAETTNWEYKQALKSLEITEAPFEQDPSNPLMEGAIFTALNGNALGYYSRKTRTIHLSPVIASPEEKLHTALHELAHAMLHSEKDDANTSRQIKEYEAEMVAMLVADALGFDFAALSRDYVQGWANGYVGEILTDQRAKRILQAADKLVKAGQPSKAQEEAQEVSEAA